MIKKALITGITGQDGAYLAELLLSKGYIVYGGYRRSSSLNLWRLSELGIDKHKRLNLVAFDLIDLGSCISLLKLIEPQEVYNLAAQSFVASSFDQPIATATITGLGALNLLEAIRLTNPKIRFYQASSSEMYGKATASPQSESTEFYPRSPYAVAKLFAHWMTINYREAHGLFASSGILFNHESPLRGLEFVTRKITKSFAQISMGKLDVLELGNLNARRDWGFAKEYVEGMWLMLQTEQPEDYVLASSKTQTVREFVKMSARAVGINLQFEGNGTSEVGLDFDAGRILVRVNESFYRPTEVDLLLGDPQKAKQKLGWQATTTLEELCNMMVNEDIRRIKDGSFLF